MKALQKTLAILACLLLLVQTLRHAYILWLEPRVSVLDKYDQPLRDEISTAASLDELLRRYDPVRKEVDRLRAERRVPDQPARFVDEQNSEPFMSERALKQAISGWEERAKELRALRFYWFMGLVFAGVGLAAYLAVNRWLGITLLIVGFAEFIYWTSPTVLTFLTPATGEFDRLLLNKFVFSLASIVVLAIAVHLLGAFRAERGGTQ